MPDSPPFVFPIAGRAYDPKLILTHHGQAQTNTGYSGVPAVHSGVDLAAPAGSVFVSPVDGTIVEVHRWTGGRDDPYGNTLVVQAADGTTYRGAHLLDGLFADDEAAVPVGHVGQEEHVLGLEPEAHRPLVDSLDVVGRLPNLFPKSFDKRY